MNNNQKDKKAFIDYIDSLKNERWLDKSRSWWPRFVFHFTNIDNAIQILECGHLKCRSELEKSGGMATDNASETIIQQTSDRWKDYVRMYFRPRTPTQYNNEGYRPERQRELSSHCPVPVYFLFDSKQLLTRENVYFSKGSLASGTTTKIFSDSTSFKEIPFRYVYHDSWFDPSDRNDIIYHRQAEVVVPGQLDFDNLKGIFCRSEAEYQTLLQLISPDIRSRYGKLIGTGNKANLFFKSWLFIEKVDLSSEGINITFNLPTRAIDPIHIKVIIIESTTNIRYVWENDNYRVESTLEVSLTNLSNSESYTLQVYFGNQIMYSNKYNSIDNELPF